MARIFAYIVHKAGVPDDSAFELAAAAKDRSGRCADGHSHRFGRRPRCRVQDPRCFLP